MRMTDNTILITGGASGIGLALAEALLKLGNQVLVAGRSLEKLSDAAKRGLKTYPVDMTKAESITAMVNKVLADYPSLNGVIHNAGIMKNENLLAGTPLDVPEETLLTNLLGPMRLTNALLPHFKTLKSATIITVTSGLGFVPLAITPSYSASKAGLHSYTESLRYQLRETAIEVIELIPPYVQTHLMGDRQANDPNAMPLPEFIDEVMGLLQSNSRTREILVKRVQPLRFAVEKSPTDYQAFLTNFNDRMLAARKAEFN